MTATGAARPARRPHRIGRLPMARVAWRQHGASVAISLALIATAIGILAVAIRQLPAIAASIGPAWTWVAPENYSPHYPDLVLQALWALIAVFVGVPLAGRDIATGTAAFAWTQGTTRTGWLLGKLLAVAAVLAGAATAFGLVFAKFFTVYTPVIGRWTAFGLFAPALVGWTMAGLTLGMTAGVVLRRSGRALAAGLAGYLLLDVIVSRLLRPRYLSPVSGAAPRGTARTAALLLGRQSQGQQPPGQQLAAHAAAFTWLYQPGSRFWVFQLIELLVLLAFAAACTAVTCWLVADAGRPSGLVAAGGRMLAGGLAGALRLLPAGPAGREQASAAAPSGWDLAAWTPTRRQLPPWLAMTRLTWRLHGRRLLTAVGLLGAAAIALALTRPAAGSLGQRTDGGPLTFATVLPFVIGAFTGGALVAREIRSGSARFAWTQGISRGRWAAGQLIRTGLVLALAAIGFGLFVQWWAAPAAAGSLDSQLFDLYAPAFAGWTLLSFTVGGVLGAAFGDTASAVIPTLVIVPIAAVLDAGWRPRYLPADRFWLLQFGTAAGLLAASAALAAATIWLVRRRSA